MGGGVRMKASPSLFSGSTPKHDRSSPSHSHHSRSPGAYTPTLNAGDSGSESGSSVAEKSHHVCITGSLLTVHVYVISY